MDDLDLLDQAYAWTTARIAVVSADDLEGPTPCSRWDVQTLLDHLIDTLTILTDAIAAPSSERTPRTSWHEAIAELANRSRQAWRVPGVLDRTYELPFGTMPGPVVATVTLLEAVVHGWDLSQATGEAEEIPDAFALPLLDFVREALPDAARGNNFAAALGIGDTPSDQLVAFLGRKPR
jgi:uncharacterized protein (TIGR03086 family)